MRILIIHTAFIGDIVLSTPLVRKLKDIYPESEITYVTTPAGTAILKNNPAINEIIVYDKRGMHKGIKGILELSKRLRSKNFNLVITPHRYLRSSLISWLTRAPERIGYDSAAGSFLFTKKVSHEKGKHEVEKLLSFTGKKGSKRYEIELYPSEADEKKIADLIEEKGFAGKKIVAVAIGSKWFTKKWPLEYFNEVIKKLGERKDLGIILVGGKEESFLNAEITENTLDLRGKTTLLELAAVLERSDVVVTNDSSPIHIASAFRKTHIIAIFGPTVKEFGFFPWSENSEVLEVKDLECRPCSLHGGDKCPKAHFKCMLDIKPELVLERVLKYIEEKKSEDTGN